MHTGYTLILALIYLAGMAAFTVAFLVDWIRSFDQIRGYWKPAVATGAVLVGLNVMMILIMPADSRMIPIIGIVSLPVLFARTVGFAMLGMHYCARIGYPSFRLLPKEPPVEEATPTDIPSRTADDAGPRIGSIGPDISPALAEMLAEPAPQVDSPAPPADGLAVEAVKNCPPEAWSLRGYAWNVLIVAAVSVGYSTLLFLLAKPRITETVQRIFGARNSATDTDAFSLYAILLVLAFAFGEEIFFRLGIQNFLARYLKWQGRRYWAAIALTSLVWTLGHAGVLDPDWVKLAQIYPVGLMLGWLFRRHGVEACMLAHSLFNIVMTGLSSILLP